MKLQKPTKNDITFWIGFFAGIFVTVSFILFFIRLGY